MLRLSKMADYGIVLLSYVANAAPGEVSTARLLAERSALPLPTVSKVLKSLARAGLLVAHRGKHGGYTLARHPSSISVAEMIHAVDGPIALTVCSPHSSGLCELEGSCPVRSNWNKISTRVHDALEQLTLADMAPHHCSPAPQPTHQRLALVR